MANVCCDPRIGRGEIGFVVGAAFDAVKPGGSVTFLDTYSPELGLDPQTLGRHPGIEVARTVNLKCPTGQSLVVPTPEWVETAGHYSVLVRRAFQRGSHTDAGRFVQLKKS